MNRKEAAESVVECAETISKIEGLTLEKFLAKRPDVYELYQQLVTLRANNVRVIEE
jgi:hypothetical protein